MPAMRGSSADNVLKPSNRVQSSKPKSTKREAQAQAENKVKKPRKAYGKPGPSNRIDNFKGKRKAAAGSKQLGEEVVISGLELSALQASVKKLKAERPVLKRFEEQLKSEYRCKRRELAKLIKQVKEDSVNRQAGLEAGTLRRVQQLEFVYEQRKQDFEFLVEQQFTEEQRRWQNEFSKLASAQEQLKSQNQQLQDKLTILEAKTKDKQHKVLRGSRSGFGKTKKQQQRKLLKQFQKHVKKLTGGDLEVFWEQYFSIPENIPQLISIVCSLKELVQAALDDKFAKEVKAGGHSCSIDKAIALRLFLTLSDEKYKLLSRVAPGWLPPLCQLRKEERNMLPSLQPVHTLVGEVIGWQLQNPADMLKQAVTEYVASGGKGCKVIVKIGTDNFSVTGKKQGTTTRYQQVAAIAIFEGAVVQNAMDSDAGGSPVTPQVQPAAPFSPQTTNAKQLPECEPICLPELGGKMMFDDLQHDHASMDTLHEAVPLIDPTLLDEEIDYVALLSCDFSQQFADFPSVSPPGSPRPTPTVEQQVTDAQLAGMQANWKEDIDMSRSIPYNSPFQAIPIAFYEGPESADLLRPIYFNMNTKLLPVKQLCVDGEEFQIKYHNCGDFAALCKVYGLRGQHSTFNCLWCLSRYGQHGVNMVQQLGCERDYQEMSHYGCAAMNAGFTSEKLTGKDTQGMKHPPLTNLGPIFCVIEGLHCRSNMVETHIAHTHKLAGRMYPPIDLYQVLEGLNLKRPVLGYEGRQCLLVLQRRAEWLEALCGHPDFHAIRQRWEMIALLLRVTHTPQPTQQQIDDFRIVAENFGHLMNKHWGVEAGELRYAFHFYDHALICHAHAQLQQYGSLFMFSTWYLEHMNKWWKRFISMQSSQGGGVNKLAADSRLQCLRKFILLTHPRIRAIVEQLLERQRGVYHCTACGQPKHDGHTSSCKGARELKLRSQVCSKLVHSSLCLQHGR